MSFIKNDRLEVLEYIKRSVGRMRELAKSSPDKFGAEMLTIAEQIAEGAAKLEAGLIEAGYIPSRLAPNP